MNDEAREQALSWGRLVAFFVLAAWIFGGPVYKQVLGGKSKWIRPWVMFSGKGIGVVKARFEKVDRKGRHRKVDLAKLFDAPPPFATFDDKPDKRVWMIHSRAQWNSLVHKICRKLGRRGDLRATAYIGRKAGWLPLADEDTNLCSPEARKAAAKAVKRKKKGGRRARG